MSDASKEHKPFDKPANPSGRHPRSRVGATAKKRERQANRRQEPAPAPVQQKGKKK